MKLIGIPEDESGTAEIPQEVVTENFPQLRKQNIDVVKSARKSIQGDHKLKTPRNLIIALTKTETKEKLLQAARGKDKLTY